MAVKTGGGDALSSPKVIWQQAALLPHMDSSAFIRRLPPVCTHT